MLAKVVVGLEALIGFLNPQQLLLFCSQSIEDRLAIPLTVDEEVPAKLSHQRWYLDMLGVGQRRLLVQTESG
jgi:hypothetical protein